MHIAAIDKNRIGCTPKDLLKYGTGHFKVAKYSKRGQSRPQRSLQTETGKLVVVFKFGQ
jgi:hypothetical protein